MREKSFWFLAGIFLYLSSGFQCLADMGNVRALEDRAGQRILEHFIHSLQRARNIAVHPNRLLPNAYWAEHKKYCEALVDAARNKSGEGITVPPADMSTGRNGNAEIFEYIRKFTKPCVPSRWLVDGIPSPLVNKPEYPRLYSVFNLKGAEPLTIVQEIRFYDGISNDLHSVRQVNLFPKNEVTSTCYTVARNSATFPRGEPVEDYVQAGALQFAGKVFFYEGRRTDYDPRSPGDWTRKWNFELTAPQMSTEELFSQEAAEFEKEMAKSKYADFVPHWYCTIAYD